MEKAKQVNGQKVKAKDGTRIRGIRQEKEMAKVNMINGHHKEKEKDGHKTGGNQKEKVKEKENGSSLDSKIGITNGNGKGPDRSHHMHIQLQTEHISQRMAKHQTES